MKYYLILPLGKSNQSHKVSQAKAAEFLSYWSG